MGPKEKKGKEGKENVLKLANAPEALLDFSRSVFLRNSRFEYGRRRGLGSTGRGGILPRSARV